MWSWYKNNPEELGPYFCLWCPGPLCHQATKIHVIDCIIYMSLCLQKDMIPANCSMSVSSYDEKCNYRFTLSENVSARKGLRTLWNVLLDKTAAQYSVRIVADMDKYHSVNGLGGVISHAHTTALLIYGPKAMAIVKYSFESCFHLLCIWQSFSKFLNLISFICRNPTRLSEIRGHSWHKMSKIAELDS